MIKTMTVLALLVGLSACATVQPVRNNVQSTERQVVDKSYTIGVEKSVYVGQPMIRVKDYWVRQDSMAVLKPDRSFSLRYPLFGPTVDVPEGQEISIVGTQTRDGKSYRLVKLQPAVPVGLLINEDGTFDGRGVNLMLGSFMGYSYKPDPSDVRLLPDKAESVVSTRGFTNFEIVYSGVSKDEVNLLYREYTPDDMARPAYSQSLTYARDQGHVRFRDIRIQVLDASNESIRFVVEQDGLGTNP